MIIVRPEEIKRVSGIKKWTLIYGRRKTGKTFLVKNFIDYDEYFFVKKDRTILLNDEEITYETFLELLKRTLKSNRVAVIDEFHRLGEGFFDLMHAIKKEGRLILISSTLFLSKKLISSHSALLGFFAEVPIGLISIKDCLKSIHKTKAGKKELAELAVLLREPICIDYFDERKKAREIFENALIGSIKTIPALVGEIFSEEERTVSNIYEGVLRAIAMGKVVSSEISSYLFSRRLIKKDDPSVIQQYLSNLVEFGIIKKMAVHGKNVFTYKHVSPLTRIFYYADEKYNITERKIDREELKRIIDEIMPKIMEDNLREFFAEQSGLKETVLETKDYEVDACFLKFKQIDTAMEIKWKTKIAKKDILKTEEKLQQIKAKRRLMLVPDRNGLKSSRIKIVDLLDLL